jgi:alkyl sulfatase BDS1-like metallo-beta-lactamase superfamily hydrolase
MDLSKNILCGWLALLGWQIETGRDRDTFLAVARRLRNGHMQVAAASTTRETDLPMVLFEAVCARLEADRDLQETDFIAA